MADYIPLANRGERLLTNRRENERAVLGTSSGITAESPHQEDSRHRRRIYTVERRAAWVAELSKFLAALAILH